jgi:hypothetical protein
VKVAEIISRFPDFTEECSKALCCHERALFYSDDTQDDPLSEIEKRSHCDPAILITLVYSDAFDRLFDRLASLTSTYQKRRKWLRVSDRDEKAVIKSRMILSSRCQALTESIKASRASDPERSKSVTYKCGWDSQRSMCHLLMDEISHLGNRIHDFDSIHRVRLGFFITLFSIALSFVVGVANLTEGHLWHMPTFLSDQPEDPDISGPGGAVRDGLESSPTNALSIPPNSSPPP